MTVICFSGPSLPPNRAARLFPEAVCLPPASQGDVYNACRDYSPKAVCLIDGVFEQQPAVTHKELLWALGRGIAVYGAASMGALRALELAPFGMIGFGRVYELYARAEIEYDDEVAVVHGSVEQGFRKRSEALVNIRLWLKAACRRGVLPDCLADELVCRLKNTFYADRDLERLLQVSGECLPAAKRRALNAYLTNPKHRRDAKRRDAKALLQHVRSLWLSNDLPIQEQRPEVPETAAWVNIKLASRCARAHDPEDGQLHRLVEEVQLAGPRMFTEVIRIATWRALCSQLQPAMPSLEMVPDRASLDEAAIARLSPLAQRAVLREVPAALRAMGELERLMRRAEAKQAALGAAQPSEPNQAEVTRAIARYFRETFDCEPPVDLHTYAMHAGFPSGDALAQTIWRDRHFLDRMRASP